MNLSLPISEGDRIYNDFMANFPNLHKYFEQAKENTLKQGFVLINKLTGLKCYFPQYEEYLGIQTRLESYTSMARSGKTFKGLSSEFWLLYRDHKEKQTELLDEIKALLSRYFRLQGPMERAGLNFTIQGEPLPCLNSVNSGEAEMLILSQA